MRNSRQAGRGPIRGFRRRASNKRHGSISKSSPHFAVTQKPGALVGRGLTSDVFEYGPDRVVKLFFDWRSRENVEREFMVTRAVHAIGAPVPQAFELIQIEGRNAIV